MVRTELSDGPPHAWKATALSAATHARQVCREVMVSCLSPIERHDSLALPSAQVWPFDAETPRPRSIAGRTIDTCYRWMEVVTYATPAGLPCVSVPVGFNAEGLPMGMQLIGRPQADLAVPRIAQAHAARATQVLDRLPVAVARR